MKRDQNEGQPPSENLGDLLAEFGDEFEIVKEDDGNLAARRRHPRIHWRATGPVVARADTPAALRKLLTDSERSRTACDCHSSGMPLDAVLRGIGPELHAAGLDIREVRYRDETIELIVTNPGDPSGSRVIVDRSGVVEWDHWCGTPDAANGTRLTSVIIAALDTTPATGTSATAHPCDEFHR